MYMPCYSRLCFCIYIACVSGDMAELLDGTLDDLLDDF